MILPKNICVADKLVASQRLGGLIIYRYLTQGPRILFFFPFEKFPWIFSMKPKIHQPRAGSPPPVPPWSVASTPIGVEELGWTYAAFWNGCR